MKPSCGITWMFGWSFSNALTSRRNVSRFVGSVFGGRPFTVIVTFLLPLACESAVSALAATTITSSTESASRFLYVPPLFIDLPPSQIGRRSRLNGWVVVSDPTPIFAKSPWIAEKYFQDLGSADRGDARIGLRAPQGS